MRRILSLAVALSISGIAGASAQTSFMNPNGAGGYTVITPGQSPTFINPNGAGGYVAITPGQSPTFINPNGAAGYTTITPGGYQAPLPPPTPSYGYRRY